jgi:MFS family permease
MAIGLAFLPVTVVMGGLSLRYTDKLIARFGARRLVLTGLGLVVVGLLYFARVPADGSYVRDVLPSMLLLGVGGGLAFPSLAALAMSSATPEDAGLASGVFSTTAEVGSALGLAVLATLSSGGYRLPFSVAAVMVAAGLAVFLRPARAPEPSARELVTV